MTSDTSPRPAAPGPTEGDMAHSKAAARVRRERPGWVVIWAARKGEYQARPLFSAPRDTVVTGATPRELTGRMDKVEQSRARARRS